MFRSDTDKIYEPLILASARLSGFRGLRNGMLYGSILTFVCTLFLIYAFDESIDQTLRFILAGCGTLGFLFLGYSILVAHVGFDHMGQEVVAAKRKQITELRELERRK